MVLKEKLSERWSIWINKTPNIIKQIGEHVYTYRKLESVSVYKLHLEQSENYEHLSGSYRFDELGN
jgi:hypothetical protein